MDKIWIRDASGNPTELRDVWIRDNGQLHPVDRIWIRDNAYAYSSTVHYDNLPEPLISPPTPTYNEQAFAKGHRRWVFVPESTGDPLATGTINIQDVLNFIGSQDLSNKTYGILDFENPYTENLRLGVTDSTSNPNYINTRDQFIALIQEVKNAFPQIKWAFYLIPNVRFFIANSNWWQLEQDGNYKRIEEEITKYVNAYGPIMDHQDFLSPSIMDRYVWEDSDPNTQEPLSRHFQSQRWVHYSMETCKRHNETRNQNKPIIPNPCPMYQYSNYQDGYIPIFVPDNEMKEETIYPALGNGSKNEFLFWSAHNFWISACFNTNDWPLIPPVNDEMAYRISRYRIAYVLDHDPFNGGPEDWVDSTGQYQEALRHSVCQRMIEFMDSVKSMTTEYLLDNSPPILVYPNSTPDSEETEIVIFNQGTSLQLPSLRYDQIYTSTTWSTNIENSYRKLGVKFGMNTGVGSSGSTGTLITAAQQAFSGVIDAWNNQISTSPTTPFNWDWGVSINIENGTSVAAILRGGKNANDVIPLNYKFLDRSGNIDDQTQQVINTIQHYYPEATNETITYHQLHDSCLRANNDVAVWLSQQIPTARRANWWKTAANPISLVGSGWWNNNNPVALDADGTPPNGLDYDYQQAAQGLRTILGNQLYRVENGTEVRLPDPPSAWSYGMSSYPYGTYQARANSVAFEQCDNSSGIENNVDIVVHQSYFPVYPIERTLDRIPNNGYTFIGNNALVNGFTSSGDRYIIQPDAILALKKTTRINWFANWKKFGNKASIGTELCFDYGGFANNRFSGLAMDIFDYDESVVKGILDKVTEEESILYSIPKEYVGKRLIPRYWTFWTADYFYLSQIMSWIWSNNGQTYHGRGSFSESSPNPTCTGSCIPNPDALYRARSNVEWRFSNLADAPSINWLEGSQWHGFICRQLDLFGIERCQLVKEQIEIARQDN